MYKVSVIQVVFINFVQLSFLVMFFKIILSTIPPHMTTSLILNPIFYVPAVFHKQTLQLIKTCCETPMCNATQQSSITTETQIIKYLFTKTNS